MNGRKWKSGKRQDDAKPARGPPSAGARAIGSASEPDLQLIHVKENSLSEGLCGVRCQSSFRPFFSAISGCGVDTFDGE